MAEITSAVAGVTCVCFYLDCGCHIEVDNSLQLKCTTLKTYEATVVLMAAQHVCPKALQPKKESPKPKDRFELIELE